MSTADDTDGAGVPALPAAPPAAVTPAAAATSASAVVPTSPEATAGGPAAVPPTTTVEAPVTATAAIDGLASPAPAPAAVAEDPLQVVGIGASAGGLDALERLFASLPPDSGAAFVVVQHLSPDHKSMMDNLLARYTAMPVCMAEQDMPLARNAVFLIPPGKQLRLAGQRLQLSPKAEHGLSLPIDVFFHSLAEQCAERAVAVVLSGTGSDGSRGLAAVNAAGGLVLVQEPGDAKFDGMPRSAIATGLADVVATAPALAERLLQHLRAPLQGWARAVGTPGGGAGLQPLDAILERLVASSGIDFRDYKPTTVLRRIERRMQVLRVPSLAAYHDRLLAQPEEEGLLRRELLIPVTRFFRDPEAFEQLAEQVLPALLAEPTTEPVRVWVACCATGEEAYSMAILFAEALLRMGRTRPVKVFATDVEQTYLDQAAAGVYPETIAAEVSPRRLEHFFIARQGQMVVRPEIRQMVIFARHNLVGDPPFTRMHLVSCRNALIYLQPPAQDRALRRLQFALAPGGHLLLGPSESLGPLHGDFLPLAGRHKIYRLMRPNRLSLAQEPGSRHLATVRRRAPRPDPTAHTAPAVPEDTWLAAGQRQLVQAYLPPSLLVGPARELLHVFGQVGELLQFGDGQATLDVLKLLPREMAWAAGLLLQAVAADGQPHASAPLRLAASGRRVRLQARPVSLADAAVLPGGAPPAAVLLSLESVAELEAAPELDAVPPEPVQQQRLLALERELEATHATLQATVEALETANEELQATNQELQATNEELMASNEELQSTNEELQSLNEELYTVNAEFQAKVDVLNSVNADLENIAKATAIPTLFVDEQLRLTRFTPELCRLFKVRDGDCGRSIEDFAHHLDDTDIFTDLRRTLASGVATEREVKSRDGLWWLMRIQPYGGRAAWRGAAGALAAEPPAGPGMLPLPAHLNPGALPGTTRAVMSFVEVSALKDSQRLQAVLDSLVEHVAVVDAQGTIVQVNAAWKRFAQRNGDEALQGSGPGVNYLRVCARAALDDPDARRAHDGLAAVLQGNLPTFTLQYPCHTGQGRHWFLMHVAPVQHAGGGAVVSHIDVTPWAASGPVPALSPLEAPP